MKPVLVKIDVAVADTGRSVRALFEMAEGGNRLHQGLRWVFDFSDPAVGQRRELRFWRPEIEARGNGDVRRATEYGAWDFDTVIRQILPETRPTYHAYEVSELFQIRHNTRAKLLGGGAAAGPRTSYPRRTLVDFLRLRWLGHMPARPAYPAAPRQFSS